MLRKLFGLPGDEYTHYAIKTVQQRHSAEAVPSTAACIIAAQQGFMFPVLQQIRGKYADSPETQNSRPIHKAQGLCNAFKSCKEIVLKVITCGRERTHFFLFFLFFFRASKCHS